MNQLDLQYQSLLKDILETGVQKKDRTGTGTISVFGRQIRHRMSDGFPLLTTKRMAWKSICTELVWFLRGDTNIKYLVDNDCHIWDGDAFKKFMETSEGDPDLIWNQEQFINKIKTDDEFAKEWGDLGPIYGKQWRSWHTSWDIVEDKSREAGVKRIENGIDQIQNLIDELKSNPDSRRMLVSAWNLNYLDEMTLPPCHYGFQCWTRELSARERTALASNGSTKLYDSIKESNYETINADFEMHKICDEKNIPKRAISLMFNMRSNDVPLGLPFNIASYGLLLEILAKEVNMVADELIGNLGDTHIYLNQIEGVKEQLTRTPFELPKLCLDYREGEYNKNLTDFTPDDFVLFDYQSHPAIKMPLSN